MVQAHGNPTASAIIQAMEPFLRTTPPDLATAAAVVALATLVAAAWWARRSWIGELTSHWTRHIAWVLLALAVFATWRGDWCIAVLACGFAAAGAIPWLRAAREHKAPHTADGPTFTLLSANLLCFNQQRAAALATLAASGAQVAVLIEVLPSDEIALRGDPRWPHQSWHHDPDWNGSAILSVHPLDQVVVVDPRHAALVTTSLTIAGRSLLLIAVHPFAPESLAHTRERNAQCARLTQLVASDPRPVVVAGDFNLTVGNPAWRDLHRVGGLLRCHGAAPATYPAWLGGLGIAIDHVLVRGLALRSLAAVRLPGSDHRGVLAEIVVPPEWMQGFGVKPSRG